MQPAQGLGQFSPQLEGAEGVLELDGDVAGGGSTVAERH